MKLTSISKNSIVASLKYFLCLPIAFVFYKKQKGVWIISERPDQARDNGYIFFKYMREKHPTQRVYYLIDKGAQDYKKIEEYGNVIQINSWKHYLYYCLSKVHISAHVNGCCPDGAIGISRRTKKKVGFKDVFLPHGVSYGVSEFCLKKYAVIDLFICSGKAEYDNILENYGYSKEEVVYTGFPRLDEWHNLTVNPKLIVLMPTWRTYLAQDSSVAFGETLYFQTYQKLLQNQELREFLEENDLHFVFYLHNEMKKYVGYFSTDCKNIEIVDNDCTYDIQELLKSAAILITDYSSVHFDFAYMGKPVIYFPFDSFEFMKRQYSKSIFDMEENGFGPVARNTEEIVKNLRESYRKSFQMERKYMMRMERFYPLHDAHNCERVWATIRKKERQWWEYAGKRSSNYL